MFIFIHNKLFSKVFDLIIKFQWAIKVGYEETNKEHTLFLMYYEHLKSILQLKK